MNQSDPIFARDNAWWFWDETWSNDHGPFPTRYEAEQALKKYCEYLDMALPRRGKTIPPTENSI